MSENLHDIDKLFKDAIDGHNEMPSGKVWDAIDNNLDKTNVIQIKRKYNNLKRLAIALLLLLLGTIVYEIQSKRAGKEEVATNGNNGNKEMNSPNNTGSNKTRLNDSTNRLNNQGDNQSGLNSATSGKTTVNNAGKYAEKDAVQKTGISGPQNPDQKTMASTLQITKTKAAIKNPAIVDGTGKVNDNQQLQQGSKSLVKKSSNRKTKIIIKNGVAEEDVTTGENDIVKNGDSKSITSQFLKELKAPQNNQAEKIITGKQKSIPEQINENRNSPDVNTVAAKIKSAKKTTPFHFSVTPFYSPQYSYNRLEDDHHDPGPQPRNGRDEIKRDEPNEKVSSFGVLISVPAGKKWGLQSGITVLNKEISIEPKKIYAKLDNNGQVKYRFDCSSGYTYISPKTGTAPSVGDSINAAASTNTLQYLGIPLAVNYTFSLGKFSIIPTAGATINFLTKQKIETELLQGALNEKQSISTIEGLKKSYFNAFAGISLEYTLSRRIALNLTPSGNFALSAINKDAAVKSYPNSLGVMAGIKIKF